MPWMPYNPNPRGLNVGDCTVRALCAATGMTWDEAYAAIAAEGFDRKDMPSSNSVWGTWLQDHGFSYQGIQEACPFCTTLSDFAKTHRCGVFVVGTGSHVVTIRDGEWFDTWNSGDTVPLYCFKED